MFKKLEPQKVIDFTNSCKISKVKEIYQYSGEGKLIKKWTNVKDIIDNFGCSDSNIRSCCLNNRKSVLGFVWSYIPLSEEEFFNKLHKKRP